MAPDGLALQALLTSLLARVECTLLNRYKAVALVIL
jgi:hypothetical protein